MHLETGGEQRFILVGASHCHLGDRFVNIDTAVCLDIQPSSVHRLGLHVRLCSVVLLSLFAVLGWIETILPSPKGLLRLVKEIETVDSKAPSMPDEFYGLSRALFSVDQDGIVRHRAIVGWSGREGPRDIGGFYVVTGVTVDPELSGGSYFWDNNGRRPGVEREGPTFLQHQAR